MKAHSAETNLIEYEYTNNLCATISHRIELCSEAGSQERSDSEIGYDLSALTDLKTLHMSRDMIEKCYINVHRVTHARHQNQVGSTWADEGRWETGIFLPPDTHHMRCCKLLGFDCHDLESSLRVQGNERCLMTNAILLLLAVLWSRSLLT